MHLLMKAHAKAVSQMIYSINSSQTSKKNKQKYLDRINLHILKCHSCKSFIRLSKKYKTLLRIIALKLKSECPFSHKSAFHPYSS